MEVCQKHVPNFDDFQNVKPSCELSSRRGLLERRGIELDTILYLGVRLGFKDLVQYFSCRASVGMDLDRVNYIPSIHMLAPKVHTC